MANEVLGVLLSWCSGILPSFSLHRLSAMAGTMKDPRTFFSKASSGQYEFALGLYEEALKLKAEQKNKNTEDFLKLDRWYQNELPKKIKSRGKDTHLTHEELVKCMKWKLARGKFSPRLKDLITMNTPRLCMTETKKAFRAIAKKDDLPSAIQALCNLKGVGPAMASVILTAASPELCGFMADECMLAIPEIESIDYTTKELLNFLEQLKIAADRLNKESESNIWSPHKIEQALWTHSVIVTLKSELLDNMPGGLLTTTENGRNQENNGSTHCEESNNPVDSNKENRTNTNGILSSSLFENEDTNDSLLSTTPSEGVSDLPEESEVSNDIPEKLENAEVAEESNDAESVLEHKSKRIKLGE